MIELGSALTAAGIAGVVMFALGALVAIIFIMRRR